MSTLSIQDMLTLQRRLQDKYQLKWGEPISPAMARSKLLWAYGEMAEVGDVIKKQGDASIMEDAEIRAHFVEELGDVFMYLFDVMLCYGITCDEFCDAYRKKQDININRWSDPMNARGE